MSSRRAFPFPLPRSAAVSSAARRARWGGALRAAIALPLAVAVAGSPAGALLAGAAEATNGTGTTATVAAPATPAGNAAGQAIGIEGRAVVELPSTAYQAKPLDDRTELILRIEKVEPLAAGRGRYHLHFVGMEPGSYLLADYLVRPDGSRPDELVNERLEVASLLATNHQGQLNAHVPQPFPFVGGYRMLLAGLGGAWVLGLAAFALSGRKKPAPPAPEPEPEPSVAERLQPLVEAAAHGRLDTAGQANLERLLIGYWRERLSLPEVRMAEAVARLKAHAEAGALLRAVERWLHQPGGGTASEVRTLLEPYRKLLPAGPGATGTATPEGRTAGAGIKGGRA